MSHKSNKSNRQNPFSKSNKQNPFSKSKKGGIKRFYIKDESKLVVESLEISQHPIKSEKSSKGTEIKIDPKLAKKFNINTNGGCITLKQQVQKLDKKNLHYLKNGVDLGHLDPTIYHKEHNKSAQHRNQYRNEEIKKRRAHKKKAASKRGGVFI